MYVVILKKRNRNAEYNLFILSLFKVGVHENFKERRLGQPIVPRLCRLILNIPIVLSIYLDKTDMNLCV